MEVLISMSCGWLDRSEMDRNGEGKKDEWSLMSLKRNDWAWMIWIKDNPQSYLHFLLRLVQRIGNHDLVHLVSRDLNSSSTMLFFLF